MKNKLFEQVDNDDGWENEDGTPIDDTTPNGDDNDNGGDDNSPITNWKSNFVRYVPTVKVAHCQPEWEVSVRT